MNQWQIDEMQMKLEAKEAAKWVEKQMKECEKDHFAITDDQIRHLFSDWALTRYRLHTVAFHAFGMVNCPVSSSYSCVDGVWRYHAYGPVVFTSCLEEGQWGIGQNSKHIGNINFKGNFTPCRQ